MNKTNSFPGKHLYKRGWLGLIPLVGAFVGLWLIVMGSFKYKDKKLALIGAVDVLFTIIVYGSMIYYFSYSEAFRKNFSVFCQPHMNELVKSIEFYKIQNGHYPDSLQQVSDSSGLVSIYDPISQRKKDNRGQFYYKRVGNGYTLFSSGVDRIPYNDDDIFPSSIFFDSTKTGLKRAP